MSLGGWAANLTNVGRRTDQQGNALAGFALPDLQRNQSGLLGVLRRRE